MGVALLAIRFLIAGIFLRAGLAKIGDLRDFRSAVANYRLLPPAAVTAVALSLPFLEIAAALLLAAGVATGLVAALLAVLLLAFAAAIAINLARGRTFDCGCSGSAPSTIGWRHVTGDGFLAGLAVVLACAPPATLVLWPGVTGPFSTSAAPSGALLPVLMSVLLALVAAALGRRGIAIRWLIAAVPDAGHPHLEARGHPAGAESLSASAPDHGRN